MTTQSAERRVPLRRNLAVVTRWLHLYLSMVSFAVVLFFAVTGLTLNHPDWFTHQRTSSIHGRLLASSLHSGDAGGIDKLSLVEQIRIQNHLHGTVADLRIDDAQISISFRAPGYTADAFVDRASGSYDLTIVQSGAVAVLNDLHKGRDAGKAWGWLIDASAILLTLVSVTGLGLLWFLQKQRRQGILVGVVAALLLVVLACVVVW